MNKEKRQYIAMDNTYKVLTNKITYDDVFNSNVSFLYVDAWNDITFNHLNTMIAYFESLEMYEKCGELLRIRKEDFHDDGKKIENAPKCQCQYPKVDVYSTYSRCGTCEMRIL